MREVRRGGGGVEAYKATLPHPFIKPDLPLDLCQGKDIFIGWLLFPMSPEGGGEVIFQQILDHEETVILGLLGFLW
jgi:hypothetical protein